MNLRIKDEYIDQIIVCPFTGNNIILWYADPSLYEAYYWRGFQHVFEEIIETSNNDIP